MLATAKCCPSFLYLFDEADAALDEGKVAELARVIRQHHYEPQQQHESNRHQKQRQQQQNHSQMICISHRVIN